MFNFSLTSFFGINVSKKTLTPPVKMTAGSVIVADQFLFNFKNIMRFQKSVHLLLGCAVITEGYGKKFYLHCGKYCVTLNEIVAFQKKRRTTFGGHFCCRSVTQNYGVRLFVPLSRSPQCCNLSLSQKAKPE